MIDQLAVASRHPFTEVLRLEHIDGDVFRSTFVSGGVEALGGGQVAAQALVAAGATVDADRTPHSLQCRYLRPGDGTLPVVFRVDRDLDGRRFSVRRVTAWQAGKTIFTASVSFRAATDSMEGNSVATAGEEVAPEVEGPSSSLWVGLRGPVGRTPLEIACAQAFVSDLGVPGSSTWSEGVEPGPSLDHVVWFHDLRSPQERWRLETELELSTSERGTYRGRISLASGQRVATFAKEVLHGDPRGEH